MNPDIFIHRPGLRIKFHLPGGDGWAVDGEAHDIYVVNGFAHGMRNSGGPIIVSCVYSDEHHIIDFAYSGSASASGSLGKRFRIGAFRSEVGYTLTLRKLEVPWMCDYIVGQSEAHCVTSFYPEGHHRNYQALINSGDPLILGRLAATRLLLS